MKQSILSIIILLLYFISGCKEEMDLISPSDQICINALLNAQSGDNNIYCNYITDGKVYPVDDANICLYCNDNLIETIDTQSNQPGIYHSISKFNTGDLVRIEIRRPSTEEVIWAEIDVPSPVTVEKTDTLSVTQTFSDGLSRACCRMQLQLIKENGTENYYRLMSGFQKEFLYGIAEVDYETGRLIAERDTMVHFRIFQVDILNDLALTDGKGYVESERNDMLGYVVIYKNLYKIFTDRFFSNDEYLLSYYTASYRNWENQSLLPQNAPTMTDSTHYLYGKQYKVLSLTEDGRHQVMLYCKNQKASLFYDVISISPDEYYYLQALNINACTDEHNEPFMNPIVLPQNFHHANGIFSIEWHTKGEIPITQKNI